MFSIFIFFLALQVHGSSPSKDLTPITKRAEPQKAEQVWCTPSNDTKDYRLGITVVAPHNTTKNKGFLPNKIDATAIGYDMSIWDSKCNTAIATKSLSSQKLDWVVPINNSTRFRVTIVQPAIFQPSGWWCFGFNPMVAYASQPNILKSLLPYAVAQEELCESKQTYYWCTDSQKNGTACGISPISIRIQTQVDGVGYKDQFSRIHSRIQKGDGNQACNCRPYDHGPFSVLGCGCDMSIDLSKKLSGQNATCDNNAVQCAAENKTPLGVLLPNTTLANSMQLANSTSMNATQLEMSSWKNVTNHK